MRTNRILIKNVQMDGHPTDIYIEKDTIKQIAPHIETEAETLIDGTGKAVIPGLINGHTHAAMTLFRGFADDMKLMPWLEQKIWPNEAKMQREDIYWGAKLACLEMIKSGTTTFLDMYQRPSITADAVEEMGLRGYISAVCFDGFDPEKADSCKRDCWKLFDKQHEYSRRVQFTMGPHAIYTVSGEFLRWIHEFSNERGALIHLHLAETEEEVNFSKKRFETFPAFSPDGRHLYFCSAPALDMPSELPDLRYSLCRIAFDPETRAFGTTVDTLFRAETVQRSFLFPRVSPDGNYLLGTTTAYGTFPIWHKDADLCMLDLQTGEPISTDVANSPDTESYHTWSSNGRWVIFSSRRLDGLYTRLFIAHVSEGGVLSKPFALPQPSAEYYTLLTRSYNIPEFVKGRVNVGSYDLASLIKDDKRQKVSFMK